MDGIDINGGGIDMRPEATRAALTAFTGVAKAIADSFEQNLGVVAGLDSQLGKGTMGARAYMDYQPFVDQVVPQLRELNTGSQDYGNGGFKCVDRYVEQDRVNQANLQQIKPPVINS